MNREDIIRMARNIASQATHGRNWTYEYAMSVAMQLVEAGAAAEREACAKLADEQLMNTSALMSMPPKSSAAWNIATAIRARGQPKKIKAVQEDDYCYGDERYYAND